MSGNARVPGKAKRFVPSGKTMTKASLGVGLETHEIYRKYVDTGELEAWNAREGRYGDFSGVGDYQACLERVVGAQEAFESLPAEVRDFCQNDPARFLDLVHDQGEAGRETLRRFGLLMPGDPPAEAGSVDDVVESGEESTS